MPKNIEFQNWAKNQRVTPDRTLWVSTVGEVADAVQAAHKNRSRVKAVGAGHSFSGVAITEGTLIYLDGLDGFESFDTDSGVITVGAGMKLNALSHKLDELGRALPNLGDIDVQTVAGAIATATHGTGRALGNISTGVTGFELVTGTGDVLWCDDRNNAEIFSAGRVSLGALGVMTKVALATVPAFVLKGVDAPGSFDELVGDWDNFTRSAEHTEFIWLPGSDICMTKHNNRTAEAPNPSRAQFIKNKILFENVAVDVAMRTVRRFPATRSRVAELLGRAVVSTTSIDKSFKIFASPRYVRFMEMEYNIPIDAVPEALRRVRALTEELDTPPIVPVEVRVSAADDIPLSTAYGRQSGWIAVHQYQGMPYGECFRGVEAIMNEYEGRPHWGKYHYQTAEVLKTRYPEWDFFAEARAQADPNGIFANDYLDRVLGPVLA